jgi:hypothetical protein
VIGDRDQADDHRAHLAQNQAFEGDCFSHFSRLLDRPTPDFLALPKSKALDIRRAIKKSIWPRQVSVLLLVWGQKI